MRALAKLRSIIPGLSGNGTRSNYTRASFTVSFDPATNFTGATEIYNALSRSKARVILLRIPDMHSTIPRRRGKYFARTIRLRATSNLEIQYRTKSFSRMVYTHAIRARSHERKKKSRGKYLESISKVLACITFAAVTTQWTK